MTRRGRWVLAAVTALAGCTTAEASESGAAVTGLPDLAAIGSDGSVLRVRDGRVDEEPPTTGSRLVALDGRTAVEADTAGLGVTRLRWTDLLTGAPIGRAAVDGARLTPTATDVTGRFVALVNTGSPPADDSIAPGRTDTTIVIADRLSGERYRTELPGNIHPEAFGSTLDTDGVPDTLYVLEYLPAAAPTHYRVRVLRTFDDALGLPVNLRDKFATVDATMAGLSRTQVVSHHDGGLLFTLYRGVAGEGDRHGYAFVHTLGFGDGGVWCLDVPRQMELDTQPGALVVAGDRLVVASANGTIGSYDIGAVLDPSRQPVIDVVREYLHPDGEPLLAATGDRVWVAWGTFVYELDPSTLEMVESAPLQYAEPVTAIAATDAGVLTAHADGTIASTDGGTVDVLPDGAATLVALVVDRTAGR